MKYDTDQEYQRLYAGEDIKNSKLKNPFTKNLRLKLLLMLLQAPVSKGGCGIEVSKMVVTKKILAFYPLHSAESDSLLDTVWRWGNWPWDMPTDSLKDYFGEKISLFFVFLAHYSWWLIIPSIIGLAFQLVVWGTLNFSHPVLPFFSVVVTLWSICMLEYWKRNESTVALKWGMSDFESTETDRPEYIGEEIVSYIDG